jgi:hypothetical protein
MAPTIGAPSFDATRPWNVAAAAGEAANAAVHSEAANAAVHSEAASATAHGEAARTA